MSGQGWHRRTVFSISLSSPGHQTYILVNDFIFKMPGCPSSSSFKIGSLPGSGTKTRVPHNMQSR